MCCLNLYEVLKGKPPACDGTFKCKRVQFLYCASKIPGSASEIDCKHSYSNKFGGRKLNPRTVVDK